MEGFVVGGLAAVAVADDRDLAVDEETGLAQAAVNVKPNIYIFFIN